MAFDILLQAKLDDAIRISAKRPQFIGFLDEAQFYQAEQYLQSQKDRSVLHWGGHEEAERRMIGFFPDFIEPSEEAFPLCAISFTYRKSESPGHRDFLGAFMNLGVTRSSVGDILIGEGFAVAFVKEGLSQLFLQNLSKIGRTGVSVSEGFTHPLPDARKMEAFTGIVASLRLDCVTACLLRCGREKAAEAIRQGLVSVNHSENCSASHRLKPGDTVSIRKKGKFVLDHADARTGKGRLIVDFRKYL